MPMTIGALVRRIGVPVKTLREYEGMDHERLGRLLHEYAWAA